VKKILCLILTFIMLFCCVPISVFSAEGDTITTTLINGTELKGSKKTFDVFARNADGEKISSSVTLNGESVACTWDDTEKTSYTLQFTQEGENEIIITAGNAVETYIINYAKAEAGESIGYATFTVELFTLGLGYLIEPVKIELFEGENAAQALINAIESYGFTTDYTGTPTSGFYLSGIEGVAGIVDVTANFPDYVLTALEENGMYPEYERWDEDWIGEFDYSYGSGWMYSINGVFPNVGFADYYLGDGDVLRTQFTLSYGSDIGGGYMGTAYYEVNNRDSLTALIAEVNSNGLVGETDISQAYEQAITTVQKLNATAEEIAAAYNNLYNALYGSLCEHTDCEWKTVTEPTFEDDGKKEFICSCGETVKEEIILKLILGDSDRDGNITVSDLSMVRSYLLNGTAFEDNQKKCSDLIADNIIDARDLVCLKKNLAN